MKMLEEEQEKSNDFSEMIITIHFSPVMGKYCDGCFHIEWDKRIPTVNKWIYSVLRKIYFIFKKFIVVVRQQNKSLKSKESSGNDVLCNKIPNKCLKEMSHS